MQDLFLEWKRCLFWDLLFKISRLLWMILSKMVTRGVEFQGIHLPGRFDATNNPSTWPDTNDSSMVGMEGVAFFRWSWNSRWVDVCFACEGILDKGISATLWILVSWLLVVVVLFFSGWSAMIFAGVYSQYLMSSLWMSWSLLSKPVEILHMKTGLVLVGTTQEI